MNVGIRELKLHLSKYIARVRAGETVVVTDRGRPVARLEPVVAEELPPSLRRLLDAGRLIYRPPPRKFEVPTIRLLPGDKTSTDLIREQRR
jgi:prevent-host-death family protein